jgi:hypothetical protein
MAFTEDLTPFFDTAVFGESVTLTIGTSPATVAVIFDAEYIDPLGDFEGRRPTAWVPVSVSTGVAQGDTLTRGGTTYTIVEVRPDGPGVVNELRLRS